MPDDKISKLIEEKTNKRIAAALERIADALEKQNAGNDEKFSQRVIDVIQQGLPATISKEFIPEDSNGPCVPGPSQSFGWIASLSERISQLSNREGVETITVKPYVDYEVIVNGVRKQSTGPAVILIVID